MDNVGDQTRTLVSTASSLGQKILELKQAGKEDVSNNYINTYNFNLLNYLLE